MGFLSLSLGTNLPLQKMSSSAVEIVEVAALISLNVSMKKAAHIRCNGSPWNFEFVSLAANGEEPTHDMSWYRYERASIWRTACMRWYLTVMLHLSIREERFVISW